MKIKLTKLKLRNFKGIKDFTLDTDGGNVKVFGDNGTGKTTLSDAWHWLLFDKDSRDQANFEIKTLDENNDPLHNLEHEVEGILEIDGKSLTLRKVYHEVWTKKRGSAKETFSGHTTDHYINDVPVKKSEYEVKIAEIINEKIFKMLTNPGYFNEQMHWEERRKVLLEVAGNISDEEVIKSNKKLDRLSDVLGERSIEDHKKTIKAQQKKINEELKKIPIRIDEVTQGLPDIDDINPDEIQADIQSLKVQKKEKEQELSRIESGGEIAQKEKQLAEIETELQKIRNSHTAEFDEKIAQKKKELSTVRDKVNAALSDIKARRHDIKINTMTIEKLENKAEELREKWYEVNEQGITVEDTCPTCGQSLPEDQVEEAVKKANLAKAEKLEGITAEGKNIKAEIDKLQVEIKALEKEISNLEAIKTENEQEAEKLDNEIAELEQEAAAYQDSFEYQKKLEEKRGIEQSIQKLRADVSSNITDITNDINSLEAEISGLQKELAKLDQYEAGQKRIQELSEKEKELAQKYEKLEEELFLCEEFERKQAEMLEKRINSKFKVVNFKLFKELVNGGLEPCCETLVNGVPYSTNLNSGARINAGLDIINTLSEHYDFYAPIFIDGRESVTELIPTESQVISLIVSEKDKKLLIELVEREALKEVV